MSHGLGKAQRLMLFCLAQHEVLVAEQAAQIQRPYRSPDRWSLRSLTWATFDDQITGRQRAQHEGWQETLAAWKAGDKEATELVKIIANLHSRLRTRAPLTPTEFQPKRPEDHDIQRFNPSRAILGLVKRGFVLRDDYRRRHNLALTREGFAEARRLGGVPESELVDLDQVQERWRDLEDFCLGMSGLWVSLREDGPPPR